MGQRVHARGQQGVDAEQLVTRLPWPVHGLEARMDETRRDTGETVGGLGVIASCSSGLRTLGRVVLVWHWAPREDLWNRQVYVQVPVALVVVCGDSGLTKYGCAERRDVLPVWRTILQVRLV
jgi:hypothetical protein